MQLHAFYTITHARHNTCGASVMFVTYNINCGTVNTHNILLTPVVRGCNFGALHEIFSIFSNFCFTILNRELLFWSVTLIKINMILYDDSHKFYHAVIT